MSVTPGHLPDETPAPARRTLPLLPSGPHGSRSRMTCLHRCGNACDHPEPNTSANSHVREEISKVVQRRSVLQGAAVGVGALLVGGFTAGEAAAGHGHGGRPGHRPSGQLSRATFTSVPPNKQDAIVVPDGFRHHVVARWGDPVVAGAPRFNAWRQTPEAAAKQFGFNCDYVGLVHPGDRSGRMLLVVNHEYTTADLMFPAGVYDDATKIRIEMQNHGMSVLGVAPGRSRGSWVPVDPRRSRQNRRITIDTEFELTGPAAGHRQLRTTSDPTGRKVLGTLNNCAGGTTPWGTVLSGEENFNQYFDASGPLDPAYAASYARYGISGSGRGWSSVDPRFDLTTDPHEPFRFGWVVELDPTDPDSTPRKHTMLGRFKHEGANVAIARDGRAVAYLGDDERGDYLYKFVSRDRFDPRKTRRAKAHNLTLLEHGTLYVAKLTGDGTADGVYDGTGTWIPLASDTRSYVPGMSVAEVLIHTRLAADKVSPTRMDRPEDVEPNPVNGKVYLALTNNSNRGSASQPADEANPLTSSQTRPALGAPLRTQSGNRNGYVLEFTEARDDHAAKTFAWNLFLVCGDPAAQETYFGGFDKSQVSPISCPDNVAFDPAGNLWISTDGNVLGSNDGVFRVPVAGRSRGHVQQFATVPLGAEACGPLISPDGRSLFIAVQHPGEVDVATFESPASTWPHTDAFPRPSVVVAYQDR
ncbi:PhoX family phosphatase [Nocardioides sp. W7]|uniref:PhoX family protein n=1 Tax=Nocardioides sp. W7 TaxID=2931390 RepID=UPI001FD1ECAA|nr:PhoX family phosphatase [Nocardioides sp. W7]